MLRSLVGSEMCIRDSLYTGFFSDGTSWGQNRIDLASENSPTLIDSILIANTNTCLLYTSDAADDLLCVDLGGRRIIKKKKKITIPKITTQK